MDKRKTVVKIHGRENLDEKGGGVKKGWKSRMKRG